MTNEKPKRIISDIRPPARKTQPAPEVTSVESSVQKPSEPATPAELIGHSPEQPIDKKVTILAIITIVAVAGWLVYVNYFS